MKDDCCILQLGFGCCAPQTLVEIVIFNVFVLKSWKKQKFDAKWCKKRGFLSLHQNNGWVFHSQTNSFFSKKNFFLPIKRCESLLLWVIFGLLGVWGARWSKYTTDDAENESICTVKSFHGWGTKITLKGLRGQWKRLAYSSFSWSNLVPSLERGRPSFLSFNKAILPPHYGSTRV